MQDDFAYYVNDGVYGAFNNLMFDHATVRPRPLWKSALKKGEKSRRQRSVSVSDSFDGFPNLSYDESSGSDVDEHEDLYTSTIFGPTCDSIDVISRSVLLPKLHIGDWLYFQNMGAYTMAAASSFNGFTPTEKFYVCSVKPKYFDQILADTLSSEEKKED
jgi:ornithine decarboxylase